MKRSTPEIGSRLARGSTAEGTLAGSGVIEIGGSLAGEVQWEGTLIVLSEGTVVGRGSAHRLEVRGALDGEFRAEIEAFVARSGKWTGRGATPALRTEAGAWVEGEFRVHPPALVIDGPKDLKTRS